MSDTTPDRPPSGGLVHALRVPRYASIGLAVGVGLAVLVYAVRVFELLGPSAGAPAGPEQGYPLVGESAWFLLLAVVLAVTTALLVTTVLTGVRAVRLAREES